jgi:hypothetical protein
MTIHMSMQFWESGDRGTQGRFLSEVSKLKDEIRYGVKGSELKHRNLYNQ